MILYSTKIRRTSLTLRHIIAKQILTQIYRKKSNPEQLY